MRCWLAVCEYVFGCVFVWLCMYVVVDLVLLLNVYDYVCLFMCVALLCA